MSSKTHIIAVDKNGEVREWKPEDILRPDNSIQFYGAFGPEWQTIDFSVLINYPQLRFMRFNGQKYLQKPSLYFLTKNENFEGLYVDNNLAPIQSTKTPWDITPLFLSINSEKEKPREYYFTRSGTALCTVWLHPRDFSRFRKQVQHSVKIQYSPLEDICKWEHIHSLLEVVKGRTSHITAQHSIFHGLGLGRYGFLDKDLVDVLLEVPPETPIEKVRSTIELTLIETMYEQVEAGGTTIGIIVDDKFLEHPNCVRLSGTILKSRQEEMKRVTIPVLRYRPQWEVLNYTAYGYEIFKALGKRIVSNYSKVNTKTIQDAFDELGIEVNMKNMSQAMFDEFIPDHNPMSDELKEHIRLTLGYPF